MPINMFTRDYIELAKRNKGNQRYAAVNAVFGSQVEVARLLGVTRGAISRVIWLKINSARIEQFIADHIKRARPDLLESWQVPGNHRRAAWGDDRLLVARAVDHEL